MGYKNLAVPFETKNIDEENNVFEGYASVFNNVDHVGDIVEKGAFKKTIEEAGKNVKVLWQHDHYNPIGKALHMEEDNHGLFVKAKIFDTSLGRDAMTLIKGGVIDVLSIGYRVIKDEWDKEKNVRRLKEIQLFEFSPVTFAANPQAAIIGAKNFQFADALNSLNNHLQNGQVSSGQEKAILNAIEALKALLPEAEKQGGETQAEKEKREAAEEIKALLKEMQGFNVK